MSAKLIKVVVFILCFTTPVLSLGAPYRITVLATNIADYGGLGEWSFSALFQSCLLYTSDAADE